MKSLRIGDITLEKPIIQGGMGVGVSRGRLAGAVSACGGLGVISSAQIGYDEPEFATDQVLANEKRYVSISHWQSKYPGISRSV